MPLISTRISTSPKIKEKTRNHGNHKNQICVFSVTRLFFCRFDNSFTDIYISNIIDYSIYIHNHLQPSKSQQFIVTSWCHSRYRSCEFVSYLIYRWSSLIHCHFLLQIWYSSLKRFQYHFCWCFEFIWINNSLTGVLEYHRTEVTMILREIQWPRCWEKKFFACSNDEERAEERAPFGKWLFTRILLSWFFNTVQLFLLMILTASNMSNFSVYRASMTRKYGCLRSQTELSWLCVLHLDYNRQIKGHEMCCKSNETLSCFWTVILMVS